MKSLRWSPFPHEARQWERQALCPLWAVQLARLRCPGWATRVASRWAPSRRLVSEFIAPAPPGIVPPGRAGTRLRRLGALSAARGRGQPGGTGSRLREARRRCAATREAACAERPRSPLRLRRPAAFTAAHTSGRAPRLALAGSDSSGSPASWHNERRAAALVSRRGVEHAARRKYRRLRSATAAARAWAARGVPGGEHDWATPARLRGGVSRVGGVE